MGYISPLLAVRDINKAIDFYTGMLGFELGMTFPTPDNPEYADLHKDGVVLMLIPAGELGIGEGEKLGTGVNLYLQFDGDIDAYYLELKNKGVAIAVDIRDEPFGIRDFVLADADGYTLTISQPLGEHEHEDCECCDSCDSCASVCQSCGMPMNGPGDYGGSSTENDYCVHCCHPDGSLKSFEEVMEGLAGFMMKMRDMDRETAEQAAREYLASMPAWSGR